MAGQQHNHYTGKILQTNKLNLNSDELEIHYNVQSMNNKLLEISILSSFNK
jgi:hypothetical protein